MIYREHYIKPIREFYDSDLIKIITGIRRSGQSVILKQIMDEIGQKTDNSSYSDFPNTMSFKNPFNSTYKACTQCDLPLCNRKYR